MTPMSPQRILTRMILPPLNQSDVERHLSELIDRTVTLHDIISVDLEAMSGYVLLKTPKNPDEPWDVSNHLVVTKGKGVAKFVTALVGDDIALRTLQFRMAPSSPHHHYEVEVKTGLTNEYGPVTEVYVGAVTSDGYFDEQEG